MINLHEVEQRCERATEGPWAWESTAEKSNEFVVGLAIDKDNKPICGEIPHGFDEENDCYMDEEIIRRSEIGANEAGQANFADADFIAHARTDLPEAIRLLREAREIIDCLSLFVPDMKNLSKVKAWLAEVKDAD